VTIRYLISYACGLIALAAVIAGRPLGGPALGPHPIRGIHRTALRHAREGLPR
jgi:hypothetical protein